MSALAYIKVTFADGSTEEIDVTNGTKIELKSRWWVTIERSDTGNVVIKPDVDIDRKLIHELIDQKAGAEGWAQFSRDWAHRNIDGRLDESKARDEAQN